MSKEEQPLIEIQKKKSVDLVMNASSVFNTQIIADNQRKPSIINLSNISPKDKSYRFIDVNIISLPKPDMVYQNLQLYKKKMFIIMSILFVFFGIIITERLVSEILRNNEKELLINVQQYFNLSYDSGLNNGYLANKNRFLSFIGSMQTFQVNFLIFTHFFITYYVAIDAIMAIKILYPSLLGYYMVCVLQLIYQQPKPFWVSQQIVSFTCQKTYSSPSLMSFMLLFILFYSCHLYHQKSTMSPDGKKLVGPISNKRGLFKTIGTIIIMGYLFCIYIGGLIFLDHLALGIIFFGLYYTVLLVFPYRVSDIVNVIAFSSQKKMIFRWTGGLGITQLFVSIIHNNLSSAYPKVKEMINYLECLNDIDNSVSSVPLDDIIGLDATYNQTSVVTALIGLLFGASYAFQSSKGSVKWFEVTNQKKLIRGILVNLLMVPSWLLIIYQQQFLQSYQMLESGLNEFLIDAIHFISLYFFLFGLVPGNIFELLNLNKQEDIFTISPRVGLETRTFSFTG